MTEIEYIDKQREIEKSVLNVMFENTLEVWKNGGHRNDGAIALRILCQVAQKMGNGLEIEISQRILLGGQDISGVNDDGIKLVKQGMRDSLIFTVPSFEEAKEKHDALVKIDAMNTYLNISKSGYSLARFERGDVLSIKVV